MSTFLAIPARAVGQVVEPVAERSAAAAELRRFADAMEAGKVAGLIVVALLDTGIHDEDGFHASGEGLAILSDALPLSARVDVHNSLADKAEHVVAGIAAQLEREAKALPNAETLS